MFERSEVVFKILCAGLGALVLWQAVRAIQRSDPLAGASIPALPSLPASTNVQAAAAKGTNAVAQARTGSKSEGRRSKVEVKGTNAVAQGTNASAPPAAPLDTRHSPLPAAVQGTNAVARDTNAVAPLAPLDTRHSTLPAPAQGTNASAPPLAPLDTRPSTLPAPAQGTNAAVPPAAGKARTGPAARPETAPGMMNAGPFPGKPGQGPPLPPAVQRRLDRIIESEILAPVIHPQPVALLGIVGRDAFLQAPNGQSGLIKEGEELGGVKLLRLGINRALIEEAGEKKELTLFSGLGSESLLSKQTNSPQ